MINIEQLLRLIFKALPILTLSGVSLVSSANASSTSDQALEIAVSRCERIGYSRKSGEYRDCVREQLRLLAVGDKTVPVVKEGSEDQIIDKPIAAAMEPPKRLGIARIERMPASEDMNKLITGRKMLGAVNTIRVCVDRRGVLLGDPIIIYSSADEVFDKAALDYAKKGRYTPPPETETVSGGCTSFRVQGQQNYDKKPIPIEVVTALVEAAKSLGTFDLEDAVTMSVKRPREASDSPLVELEYKVDLTRSDAGGSRSVTEEFEFRRWQLARQLCLQGEWSALVRSGVRVLATFSMPNESKIPPYHVLINAPVCERQGIRIRADMGDKDAAYALANSYRRGGVVWRENPEAYFWYSIAEKLGHDDAQRMRLETAKYLNSPQIDQMRQRVEKWTPTGDR